MSEENMAVQEDRETALAKFIPNAPVGSQGTLKALLARADVIEAIREVAPRHLTPTRILKMVAMAASREPKILQCTQLSIIKCAMISSELGLECSGSLGMAYLVPFWNNKAKPAALEATFIPGYRGLMDLAMRGNPEIAYIDAQTVHKDDDFQYELGLNPILRHVPRSIEAPTQDNIVAAYAVVRFKTGPGPYKVMYTQEIEQIRHMSKQPDSLMWTKRWGEGAKKTVVRQLAKYLRLSPEMARAIEIDNEVDGLELEIRPPLAPTNGRKPLAEAFTCAPESPEEPPETVEPTPEPEEVIDVTPERAPFDDVVLPKATDFELEG